LKASQKTFTKQLEHACRLTGAAWGTHLYFLGDDWEIVSSVGLDSDTASELEQFINTNAQQKWLSLAINSKKQKYRGLKKDAERFSAGRLYVFPSNNDAQILLIGADQLSADDRDFFNSFTRDLPIYLPNILRAKFPPKTTEGPLGLPMELQVELERVLELASKVVSCESAVLAIRSGTDYDVYAVHNLNQKLVGTQFSITLNQAIKNSVDHKTAVNLGGRFPASDLSFEEPKLIANWMLAPVVLGQRVIGLFVFGRKEVFSKEELKAAEAIGGHAAPSIEKSIVYAESANYLQRFALLNDLAQLASSGFDLYEVVKRVEMMLSSTFGSDSSKVWLVDQDYQQYLEHPEGNPELAFNRRISIEDAVEGSVIESGRVLRIGKIDERSKYLTNDFNMVSKLVAPMRFRGGVTGVLSLESKKADTFSEPDENLLSVVGSQVASIIENIRLNLETHERASNLLLINQIVRDFLGLTKIPQISDRAARLIAEKFNFDMVLVMILDETLDEFVAEGVAGKAIVDIPKGFHFASNLGIPAKVLESGESILLKDASTTSGYFPIPGWEPGSGVWVPLRDGEKVFGVINVEFQEKDRVNDNDLIVIEAIAGPLSSVIINARQYEQLQGTIGQLRAVRETALDISADLDLEFLLKRVVNRVRQLVDARGAELGLINPNKDEVRVLVSENPWHDYTGYTFPFMEGVAGRVAALGEPFAVADFNSWSGKAEDTDSAPFTTVAGVPLAVSGEVIGTLAVQDDRSSREFTQEDILTLELLAPQLAIFIRNARLYQELEERMEAQRLTEERLVRSAKLAAVGEMAAAVAHELNNPLTTVTGFAELILETLEEDSPEFEDMSLVLKEAQRSRDVVRRLLDFSRQSEILRVDTDINEVISMVLALVHHLTQTTGIEVRVELWDEIPQIRADRNQMQQVILNVIHNAIYSMPKGGELVIQSMVETSEDEEWIGIKVVDTGVGISEENLEKIFEPFFTTKPSGEGTGLGLSVSYSIVSEHGGYIEVDSKLNEGSIFTIWLPLTTLEDKK
jgi:signal transduction histidine kinase